MSREPTEIQKREKEEDERLRAKLGPRGFKEDRRPRRLTKSPPRPIDSQGDYPDKVMP